MFDGISLTLNRCYRWQLYAPACILIVKFKQNKMSFIECNWPEGKGLTLGSCL